MDIRPKIDVSICPPKAEPATRNVKAYDHPAGAISSTVATASAAGFQAGVISPDGSSPGLHEQVELTAECRPLNKEEWDLVLKKFDDANLYQSWSYAAARWGGKNLSHLVLRDGLGVVGAAQVILVKLPLLRGGLAYVKWGPLWRAQNREPHRNVFQHLLRALRQEYSHQRGFLLRVVPWEYADIALQRVPREEGFHPNPRFHHRTAVLDLTFSMDELRMSLTKHWRYDLRRAEAHNLEIVDGTSDSLAGEFAELYSQMRALKADAWIPLIPYFHQVQREMPPVMKAHISICRYRGEAVSGLVVSALGAKAFMWLGATGEVGREVRASFLLQWRAIQKLKSQGVRIYDLQGIDEVGHAGTTHFKLGLCGKLGRTVDYVGEFEACEAWPSRLVVGGTDRLRLPLIRAQQSLQALWAAARKRHTVQ